MHAVLFGKLYIVFFACLRALHRFSPVDWAQTIAVSAGNTLRRTLAGQTLSSI
ncbi:MAG: hypothetical protein JWM99_1405 [Verrucomicrobiales bacterium]|jgi:hypothetical protein|nr:hypothetical protein [Verrucomicrobiales bacterium]